MLERTSQRICSLASAMRVGRTLSRSLSSVFEPFSSENWRLSNLRECEATAWHGTKPRSSNVSPQPGAGLLHILFHSRHCKW